MTSNRRRRSWRAAAVLAIAALLSGTIVWNSSYAAFTGHTDNTGNAWSTGTVSLTNDQSGSAVFTPALVRPDAAANTLAPPASGPFVASDVQAGGSACVKVTYTGTLPANVRLRAALTETGADGGLGQFLLFDVDTGTGPASGTDVGCAGFTSDGYRYGSASNSTVFLEGMPATYGLGLGGWNGATQNTTRWYRLSWLLPAGAPNAAQLEQVTATFTWEAQNV
jgi:hypothetical protein